MNDEIKNWYVNLWSCGIFDMKKKRENQLNQTKKKIIWNTHETKWSQPLHQVWYWLIMSSHFIMTERIIRIRSKILFDHVCFIFFCQLFFCFVLFIYWKTEWTYERVFVIYMLKVLKHFPVRVHIALDIFFE